MNILHVTCWYPTDDKPNFGSFIKAQAVAIAEFGSPVVTNSLLIAIVIQPGKQLFGQDEELFQVGSLEVRRLVITSRVWKLVQHATPYLYQLALRLLGDFKPDLIHAHVAFPAGVIASHLASKFKVNYLISEHWSGLETKLSRERSIGPTIKALRGARIILPVSNQLAEVIKPYIPTINEVEIIPNIVSSRFSYQPKDEQANKRFLVLMNMSDRKRPDLVVSGLGILKQRAPELIDGIEVLMVGSGHKRQFCQELAEANQLPITFQDSVKPEQVPSLLQSVKVLFHPTEIETFGLVVLEALACGTAVVCSAIENLNQIAEANPEGVSTVADHNPQQWADAIELAISSSFDHEKIALQVNRMTEADFAQRITSIYQRIS